MKQNLISVNLMKLDSLMDIVGEIVITESMVTSSPELKLLPRDSFDNFMKSGRQLRKLRTICRILPCPCAWSPYQACSRK